jgi:type IV pilus assembly protein PilB
MLLGEILAELGHVTEEQVDTALAHQRQKGGLVGGILVAGGAITGEQLVAALRVQQELTPAESYLAPLAA